MPMSDEAKKKASKRMKAYHAKKKAEKEGRKIETTTGVVVEKEPEIKKIPIQVVYCSHSARHRFSIPNTEKKTMDGGVKGEDFIQFQGHFYTTQSMTERKLLESSNPWLTGVVEIFTDGVEPLDPKQERIRKPKFNPRMAADMEKVVGIAGSG